MAQASSDTETVGAQLEGGGGSSESLVARCKSKYFSCAAEREDNVPYKQTGLLKGVQDTVSCTRFCANGHLVMSGLILGVTPISVLVMLIYGVLEIASVHGQYPDSGGLIAVTWLAIIVDWFQIIVDFLSALASTIVICQLVGPARKNQRNPRRVGGRVHAILTGVASVCAVFSFALNIVSWVLQEMWNQLTSGSRLRWFPIPFEILDMIYNTIFLTFILGHFRYARRAAQYNDTLDPAAHLATKDGEVQIAGGVVAGAVTAVVPARPGGDVHLGDGAAAGVADVDAADYCVAHAAAAVRTEEEHTVNCVAQAAAAVRTDPVDNAAPGEPEYRVADDGVPYTKAAFIEHYGGTDEWDAASEYKPDERGGEDVELGAAVEAAASHAGLPPPTMAVGVAAPTPSDAEALEEGLNPMRADDDGFIVGSVVWEKKEYGRKTDQLWMGCGGGRTTPCSPCSNQLNDKLFVTIIICLLAFVGPVYSFFWTPPLFIFIIGGQPLLEEKKPLLKKYWLLGLLILTGIGVLLFHIVHIVTLIIIVKLVWTQRLMQEKKEYGRKTDKLWMGCGGGRTTPCSPCSNQFNDKLFVTIIICLLAFVGPLYSYFWTPPLFIFIIGGKALFEEKKPLLKKYWLLGLLNLTGIGVLLFHIVHIVTLIIIVKLAWTRY